MEQEKKSDTADIHHIQKMIIIYNSVLAGWSVRLVSKNTFEFKKNRSKKDINLDEHLKKFIFDSLSIDSLNIDSKNDT